jgi:hypothetical protein
MRIIFGIVVFQILAFMLGCASYESATVSESEQSLADIKKSIVSLMGDPRIVSENQREFTSQYFAKKPDPKVDFDPQKVNIRHYAVMTILGARRPYDIEIKAFVERRQGRVYIIDGQDSEVAKKLAKELKDRLNQSRENRNLIDDFRAF